MELLGPSLWDVWNGPADQALSEQYVACVAVEALTILEHLHAKGCGPGSGAHGAMSKNGSRRLPCGLGLGWFGCSRRRVWRFAEQPKQRKRFSDISYSRIPPSCFICHVQWVAGLFGAPSRYGHRIVTEGTFCWGSSAVRRACLETQILNT